MSSFTRTSRRATARRGVGVVAAVGLVGAAAFAGASAATAAESGTDRYLVVVKSGTLSALSLPSSVAADADRYPAIGAVAADLTAAQAAAIDAQGGVTVSKDARISVDPVPSRRRAGAEDVALSWGLDRVDQRALPLSGTYAPNPSLDGTDVHAYVIDTGIAGAHPEFAGRVGNGVDFVEDDSDPQDCHGHGTHVAGTIASTEYGVARNTIVHGVRVLDCGGSGTWEDVIAGMNWVAGERSALGRTVVANMSLGGGFNQAVNDATANLVASDVFVAVAAGNSGADAADFSPASTPSAVTVAASDSADAHSWFSNHGSSVDIYAPGSGITSTDAFDPDSSQTWDGTSMATPHVAGYAALYLHRHPDRSAADAEAALIGSATLDAISGNPAGTPNRLAYVLDIKWPTKVKLGVKKHSALKIDVDPNSSELDWKVKGQRKTGGGWSTVFVATTSGAADKLTRNVGAGKWRVVVPKQHGHKKAVSKAKNVAH